LKKIFILILIFTAFFSNFTFAQDSSSSTEAVPYGEEQIGRIGHLKKPMSLMDFAKKQTLDYVDSHLILNGKDVDGLLHQDRVDSNVSKVSAIVDLRHLVNDRMREIVKSMDIICEGRDMTTVVFPNAEHKFYLDASVDVQAQRRFNQGVSDLSLEEIKAAIIKRDEMDRNKAEGSLKKAPDAVYIDTSDLTINQVCAIIEQNINA